MFALREVADPSRRYMFPVRGGDVLHMHGACQQLFQHSLLKEDKALSPRREEARGTARGKRGGEEERGTKGGGERGQRGEQGRGARGAGLMDKCGMQGGRVSLVFKKSLGAAGAGDGKV